MSIAEDDCVVCGRWPRAERWARRQITEWLPVGDDEPVRDECMMTFWLRPKRSQHQALDALAFGIGKQRIIGLATGELSG